MPRCSYHHQYNCHRRIRVLTAVFLIMFQTAWKGNRWLARAWHTPSLTSSLSISCSRSLSARQRLPNYSGSSWRSLRLGDSKASVTTTARSSHSLSTSDVSLTEPSLSEKHEPQRNVIPKKFVPFPFEYHQLLELRVNALTNLGVGICRTNVSNISLPPLPMGTSDSTSSPSSQRRSKRQAKRQSKKGSEQEPDYSQHEDMNNINDNDNNNNNVSEDGKYDSSNVISDVESSTITGNNDNQRSWVVMVPRVIPGELVQVSVYRNHATYSEADLIQVLEPSPHRIPSSASVCPLFAQGCGGCQYQHVTIEQQRFYKQHHVRDALIRIGKLDRDLVHRLVLPTLGTENHTWGYRTKLTPHYEAFKPVNVTTKSSSATTTSSLPPIGFQHVNNPRLILDVPACPIATPAINEQLAVVRQTLHTSLQQNGKWPTKLGATLLLRQGDPDGPVTTQYKEYVTSHVHNLKFRFQAGNFFQNNPYMVPVMVDLVVEAATAPPKYGTTASTSSSDDSTQMTHLIDCYCGSGLFAVSCAPHLQRCTGIEVSEQAVIEATDNAKLNQLDNCHFISASAEHIFDFVQDFPRATTSVLMDPPRKGCSTQFLEQLIEFAPQRIIYVSCDPATQARDLQSLVDRYEITKVQPMDLFPQTRHIECLVVLEAKQI